LHEELDTKKLYACSQQIKNALSLKSLNCDWSVVLPWIHHYTPESKQLSKQWTEASCLAPKKTRSVPSAGKVIASVFWDAEGIYLLINLKRVKQYPGNIIPFF
jgi:hypothetical protein